MVFHFKGLFRGREPAAGEGTKESEVASASSPPEAMALATSTPTPAPQVEPSHNSLHIPPSSPKIREDARILTMTTGPGDMFIGSDDRTDVGCLGLRRGDTTAGADEEQQQQQRAALLEPWQQMQYVEGDGVLTEVGSIPEKLRRRRANPYDGWACKDIFLSLTPLFITYGLKDVSLEAGLAVAIILAWTLLGCRLLWWDGTNKMAVPLFEVVGCTYFPLMLGLTYVSDEKTHDILVKWWNVMTPAVFAGVMLVSMIDVRPFSTHYAHYSPMDAGGRLRFNHDISWQRTTYLASLCWVFAFTVATLLSLVPVMYNTWSDFTAMNVVFNYLVPWLCLLAGLMATWLMGKRYLGIIKGEQTQRLSQQHVVQDQTDLEQAAAAAHTDTAAAAASAHKQHQHSDAILFKK
ncbi:hypothetical protein CEUSTIGMA_g12676.t1 [Chlamydomonas eustigma]|uniref:Uncharacterized protein n=1 Tax=Chlamydomonas eustigma TaxID=1157962 RepID=A0A250XQA7_9CHLO|nr:hypothetical protein CEUSTIGMA_g12676.t1 [Chlamydomonas eustigma]|eukprot:GAX85257.1 hypothetical protein CEUSTIGMA_g12676.t1 [Chlamydomonas eustigma]